MTAGTHSCNSAAQDVPFNSKQLASSCVHSQGAHRVSSRHARSDHGHHIGEAGPQVGVLHEDKDLHKS